MGVLALNTGTSATGLATLSTFSLLSINFSNVVVGVILKQGVVLEFLVFQQVRILLG